MPNEVEIALAAAPAEPEIALPATPTEVEIALAAAEEHRRKVLGRCVALHMIHGPRPAESQVIYSDMTATTFGVLSVVLHDHLSSDRQISDKGTRE